MKIVEGKTPYEVVNGRRKPNSGSLRECGESIPLGGGGPKVVE
jgi:hypothetical protein